MYSSADGKFGSFHLLAIVNSGWFQLLGWEKQKGEGCQVKGETVNLVWSMLTFCASEIKKKCSYLVYKYYTYSF